MELIHMGCVDGICIVSSNSDFIDLTTRIEEAGQLVYGFGLRVTEVRICTATCPNPLTWGLCCTARWE
jgi:hypothetical protein